PPRPTLFPYTTLFRFKTKLISRKTICPSISATPQFVAEFATARLGCGNRTTDQINKAAIAQHRQRGRGRAALGRHLLAQHAGRRSEEHTSELQSRENL